MGNKLSCSCAPLIRKAYRYEDGPFQGSRRRDGHLLRLWAEVFHVSASGAGTVKWQQVSEDLVPVNITCIQDSPECVFHITAYNSQVDKILDVRLLQPGTRIGQASECFVYWKDPMTNDTWGLNFTSPIDAKQFRECCRDELQSPQFKFARKASSSYSLKDAPNGKQKPKAKRKPVSTPASPNRAREPQCTCMTAEQYNRLRSQDPRYRSSTLPRATSRAAETEGIATRTATGTGAAAGAAPGLQLGDKVAAATSSTSLYDNVSGAAAPATLPPKGVTRSTDAGGQTGTGSRISKSQDTATMTANVSTVPKTVTASVGTQNNIGVSEEAQVGPPGPQGSTGAGQELKSEGVQAGGTLTTGIKSASTNTRQTGKEHMHHILTQAKSIDYGDIDMVREAEMRAHHHNVMNNNTSTARRNKSKSTEDMNSGNQNGMSLDSSTLKRMLKPMPSTESPVTSPEAGRKRYGGPYHHQPANNNSGRQSSQSGRFLGSRSAHEIGRQQSLGGAGGYPGRGLYLELERDLSPPSDNVMFDNQCYATTPSSSNGNSDQDQPHHFQGRRPPHHHQQIQQPGATPTPGSPTSRLLLEYEMHLRNTLAKGMDAESYSLHTFEALLSQSMENLEFAESLPGSNQRSPYPPRRRPVQQQSGPKSSTLPLPHRISLERSPSIGRERSERDGYYSDRNELMRDREREREKDRERERGYLSDHNTRERLRDRDQGYMSDHNSSFVSNSRCASCIGESARAQWFRHSDGWRSGSSTLGSGQGGAPPPGVGGRGVPGGVPGGAVPPRRSPWDSLPSLRHEGSLNDSGYKSNRADSLEQRGVFDRQDSLRSDYLSDRDSQRYGMVQQASIESTDSRLCYLTSSEVSVFCVIFVLQNHFTN